MATTAPKMYEMPAAIPMRLVALIAAAVHIPVLLLRLPLSSYDANFHIFFASHYREHWFNPWNEKWFAGFSQTTYPPLGHQLIALLSYVVSLETAYLVVQGFVLLLLPLGMFRYARIWVGERAASYAALASVFLGSLAFLVYLSGQLSTTFASALYLNMLPYLHEWSARRKRSALLLGLLLTGTAAGAHHVTLLFAVLLFTLPVVWLAVMDRENSSATAVLARAALFGALAAVVVAIVLLPYWIALLHNPIKQAPIPHASRLNYILNPYWGLNYWVLPWGALALALPFAAVRALGERRLRPLFVGFYLTFLLGLGGTVPVGRWLLRRAFEVVTFERFNFWASLMILPVVGVLALQLVARYRRKAAIPLALAAVATSGIAIAWASIHPISTPPFNTQAVVDYLNRPGVDKYRYLTLGFGTKLGWVSTYAKPNSVDGDYNSARNVPEMTRYGAAQFTSAKHYGAAGMDSLRAVLSNADHYGIRYILVRDTYYEPLVLFGGWRKVDSLDNGNVTVWINPHVRPAVPMRQGFVPPLWHGYLWGTLPLAFGLACVIGMVIIGRRRLDSSAELPQAAEPELRQATHG